jgi:hypothetical protein
MSDVAWQYDGDLTIGPTGDLMVVEGAALTQQRVLARLLTNPGDYIWHLTYGGGLGQFVGTPENPAAVAAVVRYQMAQEASVAQSPPPSVSVSGASNGALTVNISYADDLSQEMSSLTFQV